FFTRGQVEGRINGVLYHFCEPEGDSILSFCSDMSRKLLEQFMEYDSPQFDIIHIHDWHCVDVIPALEGRNIVFSYHSTEYGRNGGNFGDWWEFREISKKEWLGGQHARHVTTLSQETKTEVMWLYQVPEWKITLIPNGIFPELYLREVDPGEVKKSYGIHPLAPLVLFVGRLVHQKGPDLLIEAIRLVKRQRWDLQVVMAGDGVMKAHLERMSKDLPVRFPGFLSDEAHTRLLNAADLVVIPSRNEPFGLVLTEAWSAMRCVVATDVGGLSENIENLVDGVKVPVRADAIAWGIGYALEDPTRMREMGRAGRRKVIRRFTWDTVMRKMIGVYRRVLEWDRL
ncbi:MAG: glycosyltransferase family 4 protein, partial [Methanomicrobiales archaeon]|nr:glycosyltransferase family 4 protein [Methanomicrobiales archaeon]